METLSTPLPKKEIIVLQNIMEDFACATDLGAVIVDIRGKESSSLYNFSPFCEAMRNYPEFHKLCQKCDMYGGLEASKTGKPCIYRCHAGLTDVSLPIVFNDQLHGFLLMGQLEIDPKYADEMPKIQEIDSNWKAYKDLRTARNSVLTLSPEKIKSAARLLEKICSHHSEESHPRDRITFNFKQEKTKEPQPTGKDEIQKATQYIQKNISKTITLEEVANHVYLSQYYFSKLFKKETGINFITYLNQQRIERAKILLQQSDLSIETISHNVGFSQASYFCKTFKQFTNTTPATYRKEYNLG
ncbi:PocR ligand-binding domain-containing protein [Enterococcus sp. 669A]|uniref:PocR ligand-binding domain-containing protein n=1 Tax=Candidatus Enterococcus moelleringii TaxID=2815325 RepID=A0ABS3LFI2_9ENTE|nr:PocR ligand-binding domain-containing protein [Enterococcus sp. 669A]MBO1308399.1 PocR ligand-binding domain-containing protein [Enterococcus sp. 669A]